MGKSNNKQGNLGGLGGQGNQAGRASQSNQGGRVNQNGSPSQGKLIICPTPLGNLGDVTKRSLEALEACDVVCCEDTRVTGKLLSVLGIEKRLERLDENTISHQAIRIVERIASGETIAYCSDAGMPGVSDPGQRLIACAYEASVAVEVLPGPTAVATAYVASGFTAQSFYFGSFFPRKTTERIKLLESLRSLDAVLIFYESPRRLVSALEDIASVFPFRMVAVCRELTKVHEEVLRGSARKLFEIFSERQSAGELKGEIVLVIDVAPEEENLDQAQDKEQKARLTAQKLIVEGQLSKKEIVALLRQDYGLSRNVAYELVHSR